MDAIHLGSDRMPGAGPGGIAFYGPYVVVDGPEGNLNGRHAARGVHLRMIVHPEANARVN